MLRDLAHGMRGEDVRALQNGLNEYFGPARRLKADGIFGNATRAAVEAFQQANPGTGRSDGTPDGIVGPRSRRTLFPLAAYTVGITGYRLKMPSLPGGGGIQPPKLGPGPLLPPGTPLPGPRLNPNPGPPQYDWSRLQANPDVSLGYKPYKFPGLRVPVWGPPEVPPPPLLPPLRMPGPPSRPWDMHHLELTPGATVSVGKPGESTFTVAVHGVFMRGDEKAGHQEFAGGVQLSSPSLDGSSGWSLAWYGQITDADRFGTLGQFHWWQPYAQLGGSNASKSFRPLVTGSLFPINVGYDVTRTVTISAAGGIVFTHDPEKGRITAGIQGTAGLILKFGQPPPQYR